MRDQQVAEKKALQKSFMTEKERDREIMNANINRRVDEDKRMRDFKIEQQNKYRDFLNFQVLPSTWRHFKIERRKIQTQWQCKANFDIRECIKI